MGKKPDVVIAEGSDLPYHFLYADLPDHVLTALDRELSFYPANYERTDAYQSKEWDGRVQLFQMTKSGKAWYYPAGLKSRVARVLKIFGLNYVVKPAAKREYLPVDVDWVSDVVLRDYQQDAVDAILKANGGIVSLPTGAGKTLIALKIIEMMNVTTLILVHTKELLVQWEKEIEKHLGVECGVLGDGRRRWEPITVAMTQTLASMIKKREIDTLEFGMLCVDECHRAPADTTYSVSMRCTARARMGLSATPRRTDNKDLKIFAAVGEITSNITPCDLVRRGYLAKPMLHLHHVPAGDSQFFSLGWPKEYDVGIVGNDDRNDMIVEDAAYYASNGIQTYVHVERIDHLKILYYALVPEFGPGQVAYLCGKQPSDERQKIIKRFKEGKVLVLVGTLLKEGADIPAIGCLINASGMKSNVALVQKVGRALRTADGKEMAFVVDFIDSGRFLRKHSEERYQTYMDTYGDCISVKEE